MACIAAAGCERGGVAPTPEPEPGTAGAAADKTALPATRPPASAASSPAAPVAAAAALGTSTAGIVSIPSTRDGPGSSTLREVRVGRHAGADRLVFEFEGRGMPAFKLEYVDRPVRDCGTGDPVPVAGDGWLEIAFTGAQAHTEAGEGTSGPRRRRIDQPVVRELVRTCDFEGHVTWIAGVSSPNRYTASVLSNPARLVIDVAH